MGEALGVDLRATAVAAARWRDGELVACRLGDGIATVQATELMTAGPAEPAEPDHAGEPGPAAADDGTDAVAGDDGTDTDTAADDRTAAADPIAATSRLLAGVVERALAGDAVTTVAVTYPLAPDDRGRDLVDRATAASFDDAFVVARPIAAAARFVHGDDGRRNARVAVLDMSERTVDVAIVGCARDGFDIVGRPATLPDPGHETDMAEHLDHAVSLLEATVAGADLTEGDIDAVLVVGSSDWLTQLALQTTVGTGLVVAVDPEPEVAAALGAALLAGGPDRRGRDRPAAVAGLGPLSVGVVPHVGPSATGPVGAGTATGAAAGEAVAVADAAGAHLGEAAVDAVSGVPGALKRPTGPAASTTTGGGVGAAAGSGGARLGAALGGMVGAVRASKRRRVLASAAVVAGLVGLGVGVRTLVAADGTGTVEIGASSPGAASTTTTERPAATRPDAEAKPGTDGPTSTTTTAPDTGGEAGPIDTVAPDGPGVPGGPDGTGSPGAPGPQGGGGTPSLPPPPPSDDPVRLTTLPTDTTPPSIAGVARAPGTITEDDGEFCTGPFTVQVSARVSDPSGVQQVTANWSGNGASGSLSMTASGGTWYGTIGPVAGNVALSYPQTTTLPWSVTAVDAVGNSASVAGPTVTVQGC